jgi:hypothetical protein
VRARNLINMVAVTVVSCAVLLGLLAAIFETTRASYRRCSEIPSAGRSTGLAPWPALGTARGTAHVRTGETFAYQDFPHVPSADR